jgi:PleD family two-component response regulator
MGEVLRASDQALYRAKREGRDRVSAWVAEPVV